MSSAPLLVMALALVAFSALYAVRSWRTGRFSIRDRVGAVAESLGLLALFAILLVATGWAGVPALLWVVAVALAAAGVAGLVLRFGELPVLRTRRRLWLRGIRLAISALVCGPVLIVGVIAVV